MLRHHLAHRERLRRADVLLVQRRDVRRRRRRRHALNVLEDERAAQHRRRAVRIRGRHQDGALAEQAPARRLLELDPPEPIAFHVGDAVVQRDALVEERVLRSQQIDDAAVFPEDAVGEQRQLGAEIRARIASAGRIREHRRVRHDLVEALHVEPLVHEVARQRHRTRIGEHALHLLVEHGGIAELAVDGRAAAVRRRESCSRGRTTGSTRARDR